LTFYTVLLAILLILSVIVVAEKIIVNRSLSLSKTKLNKAFYAFDGQKFLAILTNIIFFLGFIPHGVRSASAQTILGCDVTLPSLAISNNAVSNYRDETNNQINRIISNTTTIATNLNSETEQPLRLVNQGIEDLKGNSIVGLGAIAGSLVEQFTKQGLKAEDANSASLTTIATWAALDLQTPSQTLTKRIRQAVLNTITDQATRKLINKMPDSDLLTALSGLQASNLKALGLTDSEIEIANSKSKISPQNKGSFIEQINSVIQLIAKGINQPKVKEKLLNAQKQYEQELINLRQNKQSLITSGSPVRFKFRLDNQSEKAVKVTLPNAQAIKEKGLTGSGQVTKVVYRLADSNGQIQSKDITTTAEIVSIPANKSLELDVEIKVGEVANKLSTITLNLQPSCGSANTQSLNILPPLNITSLIDPLGRVTGCAGEILPEYLGFSVALYDPDATDPTGSSPSNITTLTATELPDDPNNNIPKGIKPNIENSNPFFLTNTDQGKYSFLLDEERQQLAVGATYILVVQPPENSIYNERRVKLIIGDRQGNIVKYTASSLDGRPIRATDGQTTITGEIVLVEDAERVGLDLAVLDLSTDICDAQEIQITKTGDRATAQPGDIVLYRLAIRNLSSAPIDSLVVTDTLPVGFELQTDSVKAEVGEELIPITATQNGRVVDFNTDITLDTNEVINVVYAAQLNPNALRGSGQNSAIVNAQRTDNDNPVQDGPAIHSLKIEPGIIQNTGILIGRVFVDKNFDGEQQPGEPGVPDAVIFLEDGNRVITDAEGLFSVANILPGHHTGILDLTSIPEYRLAPNVRFSERNSKSRLVKLEPGGMVRMNFGVTPTAAGKKTNSRREITPKPQQAQPENKPNTSNSDS
jgi:uncharacterized repeat protein (TIGR01451 family)